MLVPLTFRDKDGFPFTKDGAKVLYARPRGQSCKLYFEDGTELEYGYPLNYFHHEKVWNTNMYRRIDRFLLLKISWLTNRKWLMAILRNGKLLALTKKGNKRVKKYLEKMKGGQNS